MDTLCLKVNEYSPLDVEIWATLARQGEARLLEEVKMDTGSIGYLRDALGIRPNIVGMGDRRGAEFILVEGHQGEGSTYKELQGATVRMYGRDKQRVTLVERLRNLDIFEDSARQFEVPVGDGLARKEKVIQEFYVENPLAGQVAHGQKSYVDLVQPIYDKFGSFRKRMMTLKIDPEYDQRLRQVVGSMNHVGVSPARAGCLSTQYQETSKRSGDLFASVAVLLGFGALQLSMPSLPENAALAGGFFIGIPAFLRVTNAFLDWEYVSPLKEAAQETDEFLRANTV